MKSLLLNIGITLVFPFIAISIIVMETVASIYLHFQKDDQSDTVYQMNR